MGSLNPDYRLLPEGLRDGMKLYLEEGVEPGSFLRAALEDKLTESFCRADSTNLARMEDIVNFLYNECPMSARGSEKNVSNWLRMHAESRGGVNA
jgi:hypothetical protein